MNRVRRIETWARLGYFARGLVYLIIGWLAFDSNRPLSAGEAVQSVETMPMGTILLIVLALGLFGYGLYKIAAGLADLDGDGTTPKAWVRRGARILSGAGYWVLSYIAVRAMTDDRAATSQAGDASGSADAGRQASEAPGGELLLLVAGLVILAIAIAQLVIAAKAKFMEEMQPDAPHFIKPAGQLGYAARGIVLAIVGWFTLKAGLDGGRLRDFGDALAVVRDDQPMLFKLIAIGLLLFGAVSVLMARYRHVKDADVASVAYEATHRG